MLAVTLAASQFFYVGNGLSTVTQAWVAGALIALNAVCLLYLLWFGVKAGTAIARARLLGKLTQFRRATRAAPPSAMTPNAAQDEPPSKPQP